ncbi:ATP-grasp domain-containing protein [Micromonospora sp. CA-246542]|uniref:ATP-grasp domain-containing protein n=1 Tax=Micromonospora sp. CA-246542 TaxID=3239959 RepID=UPI003D8C46DB
MSRPIALIVDPVGSGAHLAPLFAQEGWDAISVMSGHGINPTMMASHRPERYLDDFVAEQPAEALERLGGRRVDAVLPGTETGVELADALAEAYAVTGNGRSLSACRRDKAAMADRLRVLGVPAADHAVADSAGPLVEWATRRDTWPVVVKPLRSAGSDGVAICSTPAEVSGAFDELIGSTNKLGLTNTAVLCQEFLAGQQYLVNSVSVDGRHYIGEIWQFDSTYDGPHQLYDRQKLLSPYGPVQDQIVEYTLRVLNALGIRHGPAHTEVMFTDRGPLLIETAARMTGLIHQEALIAAVGHNHITLTVDCYTAPERILARPPRYRLRKSAGIVALRSAVDGELLDGPALDRLRSMPELAGVMGGTLDPGRPISRTRDLFTSPGLAYLVADTAEEVDRAAETIRGVEASGELYGSVS